jgi:GTP-binding protein HflX
MRQQGGIGVRGPGEQKLEVDRRVIRKRIERLKSELEDVQRQRSQQRKKRTENSVGLVALVGYTNAGKSSLLRALTHADVYVADKLFATLDPRVRRCVLPSGRACLLADTVGFVRNLPHTLVAAFRATLEEVVRADLLLLVTDASHPSYTEHIQAVKAVLEEIGAAGIPRLLVFNKVDRLSEEAKASFRSTREPCVLVSALTGEGLDELRQNIDSFLEDKRRRVRLRIPQSRGDVLAQIYEETRPLEEKYEDNIVIIEAEVSPQLLGKVREFIG